MNILKKLLEEILNEKKDYIILNCEPTIEMTRINTKEFYGYFPYNKFDMWIWSNGHNPPHFHIKAEGWEVIVSIETGEILKTLSYNEKKILQYWLIFKTILIDGLIHPTSKIIISLIENMLCWYGKQITKMKTIYFSENECNLVKIDFENNTFENRCINEHTI